MDLNIPGAWLLEECGGGGSSQPHLQDASLLQTALISNHDLLLVLRSDHNPEVGCNRRSELFPPRYALKPL